MITPQQIEELAEYYQIDRFTIFREYLQLLFLNYLYQHRQSTKIYFKGGTAIHLLFGSPRFSEDLDFSTTYNKKQLKQIIQEVKQKIRKEAPEAEISLLYQGKRSIRFRLKFTLPEFKYPLTIRLDFQEKEKPKKVFVSPLVTRFPIILFPVISHLYPQGLLTEKIVAFLTRAKGRDVFDLWFLLEKGIKIDNNLLKKKLKEIGIKFDKEVLIGRVFHFPLKKLKSDLNKFLPLPQRKMIKILKQSLVNKLSTISN